MCTVEQTDTLTSTAYIQVFNKLLIYVLALFPLRFFRARACECPQCTADGSSYTIYTCHAFCDIFHEFLIGIVTTTQINDAGIIKNNKNINKQTLQTSKNLYVPQYYMRAQVQYRIGTMMIRRCGEMLDQQWVIFFCCRLPVIQICMYIVYIYVRTRGATNPYYVKQHCCSKYICYLFTF